MDNLACCRAPGGWRTQTLGRSSWRCGRHRCRSSSDTVLLSFPVVWCELEETRMTVILANRRVTSKRSADIVLCRRLVQSSSQQCRDNSCSCRQLTRALDYSAVGCTVTSHLIALAATPGISPPG
eukprot:364215-Chlamydomonas_euryale.AAC.12